MSKWSNDWNANPAIAVTFPPPANANPWDAFNQDELLMLHLQRQQELAKLKEEELTLRKYIVNRAFPDKTEGVNTLDLGGGYQLKAGVKFNYKLGENNQVEACLDRIAKLGNRGAFIADRIVSWTPNFLLTEYRDLQKEADGGSSEAKQILLIVGEMLTITDAAPTLEVKEPKGKK